MTDYMTEKCVWYKNNMSPSLPVSPNSQRQGSTIWSQTNWCNHVTYSV